MLDDLVEQYNAQADYATRIARIYNTARETGLLNRDNLIKFKWVGSFGADFVKFEFVSPTEVIVRVYYLGREVGSGCIVVTANGVKIYDNSTAVLVAAELKGVSESLESKLMAVEQAVAEKIRAKIATREAVIAVVNQQY